MMATSTMLMPNRESVHVSIFQSLQSIDDDGCLLKLWADMSSRGGGKKIVGLSLKRTVYSNTASPWRWQSEIKLLVLCWKNQCIVVKLNPKDLSQDLANFLAIPHITFAGVGLKEDVALLDSEYGLHCPNFVELGSFAADVKKQPRLKAYGLSDLASVFGLQLSLNSNHVSESSLWQWLDLNKPELKPFISCAVCDAYASFFVGKSLLDYRGPDEFAIDHMRNDMRDMRNDMRGLKDNLEIIKKMLQERRLPARKVA